MTQRAAATTNTAAHTLMMTIRNSLARAVTRMPRKFTAVIPTVNTTAQTQYGTPGSRRAAVSAE